MGVSGVLSAMLAILFELSRVTVPVGFIQGRAQVRLKLAVPVIGAICSLKSALTTAVLIDTLVAFAVGATAVMLIAAGAAPVVKCHTVGISGASPVARLLAPVTVTV